MAAEFSQRSSSSQSACLLLWISGGVGALVDAWRRGWSAGAVRCGRSVVSKPTTAHRSTDAAGVSGELRSLLRLKPTTVTAPRHRPKTRPSHRDSRSVRIGRMTYELGKGTGPLERREGGRGRGDRAGAARLHDPGRPGRRRDPDRPARRAAAHRRLPRPAQPGSAERGAQPQGARGGADRARPGRERRRAGRGDAAGGGRAARVRAGGVPHPQPAAGLRPDDRLGPGRAVGARRRPRHELHRDHRHPPRPGPGQGEAAVPDQPGRRLRRWLDVPGDRHPRRPARGQGVRQGPGGRRGDRRRHRPPQRDDRGVPGRAAGSRRSGRPTCSTAGRRTTTSTRPPTAST